MEEIIVINGISYEPIPQSKPKRYNTKMASIMAMTSFMYPVIDYGGGSRNKEYTGPRVDIVEEFKLIQNKQSKLSKRDRDWVVHKFNQLYRVVK